MIRASIGWKNGTVLLAAVALMAMAAAVLVAGNIGTVQAQTPDANEQTFENMDPLLNELVTQYAMGAMSAAEAAASAPVGSEESVGVIFHTESGSEEDVREYLVENGATPGPAFDGFFGADVPVSLLADASEQEDVVWMQSSVPASAVGGDSSGGAAFAGGVDAWHTAGLKGEGVKIAVIHAGFDGIQEMVGTELPGTVRARCYSGYGLYSDDLSDCETGLSEGGAVRAARIFDIAPEASIYIATVGDWVDLRDAVTWLVEEEVDVVNSSLRLDIYGARRRDIAICSKRPEYRGHCNRGRNHMGDAGRQRPPRRPGLEHSRTRTRTASTNSVRTTNATASSLSHTNAIWV